MKLHNSEVTKFFREIRILNTASTGSSITPIKYFAFPLQEQQKQLEKQEKGPLKITFVDDETVEEMIDLTGLYKFMNSQSLMVC